MTATRHESVKHNPDAKPTKLEVLVDRVPMALRGLDRWLVWQWVLDGNKWNKPPRQPNGSMAKSTDPATWCGFEKASEAAASDSFDGLGIALGDLGADDGLYLVGVDFDNCRNPKSGKLDPEIAARVKGLDCYAEVSPSGEGVKCLMLGRLPAGSKSQFSLGAAGEIELYESGRYFTFTTHEIAESSGLVEDRTEQLALLHDYASEQAAAEKAKGVKPAGKPGKKGAADPDALEVLRVRTSNMEDASDGSKRLIACCCRCVELDLTDADAVATINAYAAERPFLKKWSAAQIVTRIRQAEGKTSRGSALVLSNGVKVNVGQPDKKTGIQKTAIKPLTMTELKEKVTGATDNWPRRVGSALFVHDSNHGVSWLTRQEALFGWLHSKRVVKWGSGVGFVGRGEFYAELQRTATCYEAVEETPHFPAMPGHFYACTTTPKPRKKGVEGKALKKLIARFRPSTKIDRDLLLAAIVTTFWGGPAGTRPAFILTSDAGRGAGKTKTAELLMRLSGGFIDVSAREDIEKLKTRLLSTLALPRRNCLLDNVKSMKFSWAELEAIITTPVISGKQLYVGEGRRPNVLTWFITLNGVSLSTDLAQRAIVIKLNKGENSGAWYEETMKFIDDSREALIADVAAFLQGERRPLAKFSRWGTWEKDVLQRLPDPEAAQARILQRQAECDSDRDEAELFEEYVAKGLKKLDYKPATVQVRIPTSTLADWYSVAMNERMRATVVGKKLKQMAAEGQLKRLAIDLKFKPFRSYIYTGPKADTLNQPILNDFKYRLSHM